MVNYSVLEKLLHKVALASPVVSESLFDVEKAMFLRKADASSGKNALFVTGLARAGTTALLQELYASGDFASLTYEDMPFVMAPNLWRPLAANNQRKTGKKERAHGDGIFVNAQSPEALEEVFWKTFHGSEFIHPRKLTPHHPSPDVLEDFERYQRLVCLRYGKKRYLSKNNNNILRLPALAERFPGARFLVLFRDPEAHAQSLLRQHLRFKDSPSFVKQYMGWLSHYEFGADHRPFSFSGKSISGDSDAMPYWLELWVEVYRHLISIVGKSGGNIRLLCYERLCADPEYWDRVCSFVGIAAHKAEFRLSPLQVDGRVKSGLESRARAVYDEMVGLDMFSSE